MNKKKSVTISDIAKRVNMTTITVSRALNKPDQVKPATLARILEVARELDYGIQQTASVPTGLSARIENMRVKRITTSG